jgi:peptidoglycan-associated lipoprotein
MKKALLSMLLVSLLSACASKDVKEAPKAAIEDRTATKAAAQPSAPSAPGAETTATKPATIATSALTDPASILSKRSVYFDYDKFDVKPEYSSLVEAHARYLKQHSDAKVTLQGNTDERGSREYNIALGQHRAESVKKVMSVLGVSDKQIETVSLGEEKPKAEGHDEAAWAQNRRADIIYQGE